MKGIIIYCILHRLLVYMYELVSVIQVREEKRGVAEKVGNKSRRKKGASAAGGTDLQI